MEVVAVVFVLECTLGETVAIYVEPTRNLQIQQSIISFTVLFVDRAKTLEVPNILLELCESTTQGLHNIHGDPLTRHLAFEQGEVSDGPAHR